MAGNQFIIWTQALSVSSAHLDGQHTRLMAIINDLCNAVQEDKQAEVLESLLEEIWQYTQTHFRDEESLMRKAGFPEIAVHKRTHGEMIGKTREIITQHVCTVGDLSVDVLGFLKE